MKNCQSSGRKGFTLLEVLVAIAVFALIVTAAAGTFAAIQQAWRKQRNTIDLAQNARWAMEFMANEIRPSSISAVPAWARAQIQAGGRRIQFGRDVDGDGDVDGSDIQVQLERPAGVNAVLRRRQRTGGAGPWSGWEELANFIVFPNPSANNIFIDSGGGLYTIELTVRPRPTAAVGRENRDYTLRTQVRVRN
jgi:prepilin-type N-terminal cleavage/methylation domain-containing protein